MGIFRGISRWLLASSLLKATLPFTMALAATAQSAVTVVDNGRSWTLDNGIVTATITKDSGSMPSLMYRGMQMLAASGGTWEHNPQGAPQ